jgi:hypothetical protein
VWNSLYTYVTWAVRITLIALFFVWLKRRIAVTAPRASPDVHRRISDVLLALMVCGGGTFFILKCDPRNSLTASIEAWRLWDADHPGVAAPDDWHDISRDLYQKGVLLGFLGLESLAIPAYLALRRKTDASDGGVGPTQSGDPSGGSR